MVVNHILYAAIMSGGADEKRMNMAENDVNTTPAETTRKGGNRTDGFYSNRRSIAIRTRSGSNGLMMKSFAPWAIA